MTRLLAAIILLTSTLPATAQWLSLQTPGIPRTADGKPNLSAPAPRAADGHPDLTGLWRTAGTSGDLRDETKIQPWARDLRAERERNFYKDGPQFQCLPTGPANIAGGMRQIVQSPSVIAVLNGDLTYRQIFIDGRPLPVDPNPAWNGYSTASWEGDTLVVRTNGFRDGLWLDMAGSPMTDAAKMTERIRRPNFGTLELTVTVDDPKAYTKPWTVTMNQEIWVDTELVDEFCLENEKSSQRMRGK